MKEHLCNFRKIDIQNLLPDPDEISKMYAAHNLFQHISPLWKR